MGWQLYMEALQSDLVDIQGGTTGEGIHCGVMAGTVYTVLKTFCGLDVSHEMPGICPNLPDHWENVQFRFAFRDTVFRICISKKAVEISAENESNDDIFINIYGEKYLVERNQKLVVNQK